MCREGSAWLNAVQNMSAKGNESVKRSRAFLNIEAKWVGAQKGIARLFDNPWNQFNSKLCTVSQMIPRPQMITKMDRKSSSTASDPQSRPQMIPK